MNIKEMAFSHRQLMLTPYIKLQKTFQPALYGMVHMYGHQGYRHYSCCLTKDGSTHLMFLKFLIKETKPHK